MHINILIMFLSHHVNAQAAEKPFLTLWLCSGQIDPKKMIFPENTS